VLVKSEGKEKIQTRKGKNMGCHVASPRLKNVAERGDAVKHWDKEKLKKGKKTTAKLFDWETRNALASGGGGEKKVRKNPMLL